MPISDVIVALQGFSGAYGKIASRVDPRHHHEIRVSDVNKSSFAVVIFAWVADHPEAAAKLATATVTAVATVAGLIIKFIEFKRKNKGKEPSVDIRGDGNIVLMGEGNTNLTLTKELFELYKSKGLDTELAKIARPLEENRIDRAQLSALDETGHIESTEILLSDKPYFQIEKSTTTTSKTTEVVGDLVSLNKELNRGTFRLQNGNTVRYHLVGSDPSHMYPDFARKGTVRVECIATFDEDLELRSLEITSIRPVQMPLGL